MCLQTPFPSEIPEETRRLVEPLLAADSVYRFIGTEIDQILADEDFVDMYAAQGRPALNPVMLALIVVFQFLERLPDRAAAEAAVLRLDWKYALRQELSWKGFHYSDLSNFRKRLVEHSREQVVFERLVDYLRTKGYIKRGSSQRTDATHILGLVARLSRIEVVWESLRVALGALTKADSDWVEKQIPSSFIQAHSQRRWDYRIPKGEIAQRLQQAGQEGYWLLGQVEKQGYPALRELDELTCLRRVLSEQFTQEDGKPKTRPPGESKDALISPHETDVRFAAKGYHNWVGYKLQVTETAGQSPRFVTDVGIVPAMRQDNQCLEKIQARLVARGVAPEKQYVDQAYMSGSNLAASQEQGVQLRGYVRKGNRSKAPGFRLRDFDIDIEKRLAICPDGRKQAKWVTAKKQVKNLIAYHVSYGPQCQQCCFFGIGLCTDRPNGRHLRISRHHDLIQAHRRATENEAFKQEMNIRAGIEGTISEMVRAYGLRRSRYRGRDKNQLQALCIATATNLKRLALALSDFCSFCFSCRQWAIAC